MKVSREQLKSIIRECLVEILAEGLGSTLEEAVTPQPRRASPQKRPHVQYKEQPSKIQSNSMMDAINKQSGGDNVMKQILEDTARTTLPSMLGAESKHELARLPSDISSLAQHAPTIDLDEDPIGVFGAETQDRWASLAFPSSPSKIAPPPGPPPISKELLDSQVKKTV